MLFIPPDSRTTFLCLVCLVCLVRATNPSFPCLNPHMSNNTARPGDHRRTVKDCRIPLRRPQAFAIPPINPIRPITPCASSQPSPITFIGTIHRKKNYFLPNEPKLLFLSPSGSTSQPRADPSNSEKPTQNEPIKTIFLARKRAVFSQNEPSKAYSTANSEEPSYLEERGALLKRLLNKAIEKMVDQSIVSALF